MATRTRSTATRAAAKMADIRKDPVIAELAKAVDSISKPAGVWNDYVRLLDKAGKPIAWACKRRNYVRVIKMAPELRSALKTSDSAILVTTENLPRAKSALKKATEARDKVAA